MVIAIRSPVALPACSLFSRNGSRFHQDLPHADLSVAVSTPKSNLPALDTRKSNLLALRGGGVVSTEVLYNTQAGLLMLTGFQGLLVPVNTLEMYGLKAADAESAWMRVVSGMNLVAAVSRLQIKPWADHAGRLSSRPCT